MAIQLQLRHIPRPVKDIPIGVFLELFGDGGFVGLLDLYPGGVGLSDQKLSSGSTNVTRLRRSTDDSELDYTPNAFTDGSIDSWVGAGNAYRSIWYDQGAGGYNATPASASEQPIVVDSGTIIADGQLFDGINDYLSIDIGSSPSKFMVSAVIKFNAYTANARVFQFGTSSGSNITQVLDNGATIRLGAFIRTSGTSGTYSWDVPADELGVLTYVADYDTFANLRLYWNGTELTRTINTAPTGTWTVPTGNFLNVAGPNVFSSPNLPELLFWGSDQSANMSGIVANQMGRYSIT